MKRYLKAGAPCQVTIRDLKREPHEAHAIFQHSITQHGERVACVRVPFKVISTLGGTSEWNDWDGTKSFVRVVIPARAVKELS